ncbi:MULTISPECIES: SDR family NAD(P)-dependent oxidoreductase [Pseudomonas]|uniref:SDR family NAD(P)-dependent oxidoreductase n=1 Tax=Pseudomonas TaxID=286 RepID=UPI00235ED912|nr:MULTISPECIES: glucose 1-dehydrogenase [Pseudomonas]WJV26270.1 glucose 1-dehydrogenase [Pseudomonas chlororaphis]
MSNLMRGFSLNGQVALVTGASRGIGRTLAIALADAGARVVLAARDQAAMLEVAATIEAAGGTCSTLYLDVTDAQSRTAAFEQLLQREGRLDILLNNAGVEQIKPALELDEVTWDRIVDTNLKGSFFCAQNAAKAMMVRGGCILNLCSLTSEVGVPGATAYGASKSGLLGMTRALSAEWAASGIRVNAIGPGYFHTDLTDEFYQDTGWREQMQAKIPLGRFGELRDLAGAAVFLCSSAASYITGQVLYVDGGYLASI